MVAILTSRLEIRDFLPDDAESVQRYASDPAVTRYLSWGPNTAEETRAFVSSAVAHAAARPRTAFEFAIVERATREVIGSCGLLGRRLHYREYELGFCLRADRWRQGLGTEAVRGLVEFGVLTQGAHRLYGLVHPENRASARLLEGIGFRLEGHRRRDAFVRGTWHDSLVYALLEEEVAGRAVTRNVEV